ncbi:MAG TPA: Uma2 family endonuclease [Polyangiaceae bacterium]
MSAPDRYEVDPNDPRAPSMEMWERLPPSERRRIIAALPSELELAPPEGDPHRLPKQRALGALDAFFRSTGRRVYLSSELPVYYPGERVIAPDLIAVLDVESHERDRWVVAAEGKGIDLAVEVTYEGSRKKDLEENVIRFARLGIPEYFVFDRRDRRLYGWRLQPGNSSYVPIVPQQGRWASSVLGLELAVEDDRFRFFAGSALVLEADELLARANSLVDDLQNRLDESQRRVEEEARRAEEEARRAKVAEQRVQELEAELQRLKKERS